MSGTRTIVPDTRTRITDSRRQCDELLSRRQGRDAGQRTLDSGIRGYARRHCEREWTDVRSRSLAELARRAARASDRSGGASPDRRRPTRARGASSTGVCSTWNQRSSTNWRRYQRALKQRNAALRGRSSAATQVRAWDPELIEAGDRSGRHRERSMSTRSPAVRCCASASACSAVRLDARATRAAGAQIRLSRRRSAACLVARRRAAARRTSGRIGRTWSFGWMAQQARDRVSRGQQKLLAAALLLAQLRMRRGRWASTLAVLLVDDPAAELDADNLAAPVGGDPGRCRHSSL